MLLAHRARSRTSLGILFAAMAAATACDSGGVTAPPEAAIAELVVTANVVGTPISTLVVTVSGNSIPQSLVFNLPMANGVATGTVAVPPGPARTFNVKAVDEFANVTHEGVVTVDVKPGQNPTITISLIPRPGQMPVSVTIASLTVTVTPGTASLVPGGTQQFTGVVQAPGGTVISNSPLWATSNPAIATVSASGMVTALTAGDVDIVATYGGVAGISHVTVVGTTLTFGNTAQFSGTTYFGENYLLGSAITVSSPITLTHLAFIGKVGGTHIKMGLYTDVNGHPGQLVAGTESTPTAAGNVEIPVASTPLPAGNYWIMAVYDVQTEGWMDTNNSDPVNYIPFAFASPLPTTFPSPAVYAGQKFNYYIKGTG